jgi:energy-coupling factor transporter ATP-binding protein EcfA2
MQWIWYLPSMLVGLGFGLSSGYWQLGLVSLLMVLVLFGTQAYKNRYPQFDEQSPIHISTSAVAIGNRVLPRWQFLWKPKWHQLIVLHLDRSSAGDFLQRTLEQMKQRNYSVAAEANGLRSWIGATATAELSLDFVSDGPHLIVVGPTGSGKSEFLRLILTSLSAAQDFELALFDFKGGAALESFASGSLGVATDLDQVNQRELFCLVAKELASRERLFASAKCSSIEQYVAAGNSLQRFVVVIDEFVAALSSSQQALVTIEDIAARGRSLGVHLIAATQSLAGVSRSTLTNFRARVVMSSADPIDMVQLGINPNKHKAIAVNNWASAIISHANLAAESFNFPLGAKPIPLPAQLPLESEPQQPARSLALRQMYSNQAQELDLPGAPSSSPDLQLLSRMEGLRSLERK